MPYYHLGVTLICSESRAAEEFGERNTRLMEPGEELIGITEDEQDGDGCLLSDHLGLERGSGIKLPKGALVHEEEPPRPLPEKK